MVSDICSALNQLIKIDRQAATTNGAPHLLRIHFLIVGGSFTGYASALTLCRAGHRVTVLDVEDKVETAWGHYAAALTPNVYKLLVRWGMEDELAKYGTKATRLRLADYHTGEPLGYHNYEEELLNDSGGDLVYCHLSDLKKMVHDRAVSYGAEIRHDVAVAGISVQKGTRPSARLISGEVIEVDVILGADGSNSPIRREIIGQELHETPLGTALFNVRVPKDKMLADPELAELLQDEHTATMWGGKSYAGYACIARGEFTFLLYLPEDKTEPYWYQHVEPAELTKLMGNVTPILRKIVESASIITCSRLCEPPQVKPWIHPEGRVLLVGDAAHPFPRAATHGPAMNIGDAGALGTLFSHLHSDSQIDTFLTAFETLRRDRVKKVLPIELMNTYHIVMPDEELREQRNAAFRERRDAGLDAFSGEKDDFAVALWENDKTIFSYDAEDAAEEWWNDWGILDERANNAVHVLPDQIPVVHVDEEFQ
ncbi:hypothetical protein BC629DRAFT_1589237 [Irpex lacteus]|nr:hypothetical protein BC629DRAFT_1589237 [Irpex lacteus]